MQRVLRTFRGRALLADEVGLRPRSPTATLGPRLTHADTGEVARALRMAQPQASKHLRVLREVGLVHARGEGRRRLYGLDARGLRPIHEWVGGFEQYWSESFARLDDYVRGLVEEEKRR